jgi:UDP-N-acetylglucosamine--N-acetylmuramyl-(pentapeptide) pyrophosphoryl-undecaprenol N-acetylglucosamine transferase
MKEAKTIIFAGGGTGGHLFPGIAVAEALGRVRPELKPLFLCTERELDRTILQPTGFEYVPQPIVPPARSIGGLLRFFSSWRHTRDLVRAERRKRSIVGVVGLGGYAAGVAVKYLAQKKIPAILLNPDVVPGKANQYLMPHVRAVCAQFERTAEHLQPQFRDKLRVTGCPIRAEILRRPSREEACRTLGLNPAMNTLVVTGASQGAATVNEAVLHTIPKLNLQGWQILHLAGKDHAQQVRDRYRQARVEAAVVDFKAEMGIVWACADLAVSRAGASSCAELCACGVASILMPYPYHKDMHQRANARELDAVGAAILLDDRKKPEENGPALLEVLAPLLVDAPRRSRMSAAARSLAKPDAADRIADVVLEVIGQAGGA